MTQSSAASQAAWQALQQHQRTIATMHLNQLADDPLRFQQCSLRDCGLLFDFSKQHISSDTLSLLLDLAHACQIEKARDALFAGNIVNQSEQRPALHMAWRYQRDAVFPNKDNNVMPLVKRTFSQMVTISQAIRNGGVASVSGKAFTDIIHIGIGGSSVGTALLYDVLHHADGRQLRLHFVETLDSSQLHAILARCQAETTAIIIASKSFTTQETLRNATLAIDWLSAQLPSYEKATIMQTHCFAVTAHREKADTLGIKAEHIFDLPDWIGGRYCVCSAVSFSVMAAVGNVLFDDFLEGMHAMDTHFITSPLTNNMPVVHALLRIWSTNFFEKPYYAILPYAHDLRKLVPYLQQLDMESNGKSVCQDTTATTYNTAPLLWGGTETQAQHSVHQWLQQSPNNCPVDFITCANFTINAQARQSASLLFSHCLSQSLALMQGKTQAACEAELRQQGVNNTRAAQLSHYQVLPGNRASSTIVLSSLEANTLGALLALYEHSTFVQAAIWQINPFDQWGVEEGKRLANQLQPMLAVADKSSGDTSTDGLMDFYRQCQK